MFQTKAEAGSQPLRGLKLPQVNIDGHKGPELGTALGTIVTFERGGVRYTAAGSVPPVAAENAGPGASVTDPSTSPWRPLEAL